MPRTPRVHGSKTLYHVSVVATGFEAVFLDNDDRECFLRILGYAIKKHGWLVRAYVLMTTHYHLLVWTPDDNLSRGMQLLSGFYAQLFNKRHGRPGHLVRGRFSSKVVERPGHALEVCRYIVLNPVRAGLCSRPEDWWWSSYRATIGLAPCPPYLDAGWVQALFHRDSRVGARLLRRFVEAALPSDSDGGGVRP